MRHFIKDDAMEAEPTRSSSSDRRPGPSAATRRSARGSATEHAALDAAWQGDSRAVDGAVQRSADGPTKIVMAPPVIREWPPPAGTEDKVSGVSVQPFGNPLLELQQLRGPVEPTQEADKIASSVVPHQHGKPALAASRVLEPLPGTPEWIEARKEAEQQFEMAHQAIALKGWSTFGKAYAAAMRGRNSAATMREARDHAIVVGYDALSKIVISIDGLRERHEGVVEPPSPPPPALDRIRAHYDAIGAQLDKLEARRVNVSDPGPSGAAAAAIAAGRPPFPEK